MTVIDFTAANGVPFRAVYLAADEVGNYPAAVEAEALTEFYDRRYPHTPDGQFVSRYYAETLLAHGAQGLNLDGGVPDWTVDTASMRVIYAWIGLHFARTETITHIEKG